MYGTCSAILGSMKDIMPATSLCVIECIINTLSAVSSLSKTTKRFGLINVLDCLLSESGDVDEFKGIRSKNLGDQDTILVAVL